MREYCANYEYFLRRKCALFVTLCRALAEQTVNADSIISPNISCICLCVGFDESLGRSAVKVTEIQTALSIAEVVVYFRMAVLNSRGRNTVAAVVWA